LQPKKEEKKGQNSRKTKRKSAGYPRGKKKKKKGLGCGGSEAEVGEWGNRGC